MEMILIYMISLQMAFYQLMKSIITLHYGQAGVQTGHAFWQQMGQEHQIGTDGKIMANALGEDVGQLESIYEQSSNGKYRPRALFIDMEPSVTDELLSSHGESYLNSHRNQYDKKHVVAGKEEGESNFARCAYVSSDLKEQALDSMRKQVQKCDYFDSFFITHSINGGCGSGLAGSVSSRISCEFPKKKQINVPIFPSRNMGSIVVEPYNAILSIHELLSYSTMVIPIANEQIYGILEKTLDISDPNFYNVNQFVSETISAITTSLRFPHNQKLGGWSDFFINSIPYPRIKFMTPGMAPLLPKDFPPLQKGTSCSPMVNSVFDRGSWLINSGQPLHSYFSEKYMSCSMFFRGTGYNIMDINKAIDSRRSVSSMFYSWVPTTFKNYLNETPLLAPSLNFERGERSLVMIANSSSMGNVFSIMSRKFDLMYAKRAFVHWYVGIGLDEGFFGQAREDEAALEKDYEDWEGGCEDDDYFQ